MSDQSRPPVAKKPVRPMRVFVRPNSRAEELRHPRAKQRRPSREALAPGLRPTPEHDLKFRGGRTIPQLSYLNFYVGGRAAWTQSDVDSIDSALAAAMSDPRLNNVMRQYFANQPISTTFLGSHFAGATSPAQVNQTSAEQLVGALFSGGQLSGLDFPSTVVNLMLPRGTVLTDGTGTGTGPERAGGDEAARGAARPGTPEAEEASSLQGLGGYHGSVEVGGGRIYYAVGVYSQRLPDGAENGIAAFDVAWKNVVATFYHELNEARTDPDVAVAIDTGRVDGVIGWNSDDGEEVGDFPVFEASGLGSLAVVFQEVALAQGGAAPVQFQYSNAVHGPEGPIDAPHELLVAQEMEGAPAERV